ncbi:hypothetical protein HYZ80_02510 [Candidatus Parcubacteria bacterium]|nr:hypothetical protein [Candidatus Parcubacteria bacterium]
MHSNRIEKYKQKLKLTKRQRQIVVGAVLGDGHLETQDAGRTYRLKIEHSVGQRAYVDWLYDQLKPLVGTLPKARVRTRTFPSGYVSTGVSYGFATYSLGALRFYAQQFYRGGEKIVPRLIGKLLTPTSIAIWYLDDGSVKSNRHRTFVIHTYGYARRDLQRLQSALEQFGIRTTLHTQVRLSGRYLRLYVVSESAATFRALVEPIIRAIPQMHYKLGNKLPKR